MNRQPPGEPREPDQPEYSQQPTEPGGPYNPPDAPGQLGQYGPAGEPGQYSPAPYGQPGQQGQPWQPGPPSGGYPPPSAGGYPPSSAGGYPPPLPAARGTNVMAILSLVFAFVFAPAGIVLGHLAKRQIRQTGEAGDQLATWGLVLSYIFTALYLIGCCAWFGLLFWARSDGNGGAY